VKGPCPFPRKDAGQYKHHEKQWPNQPAKGSRRERKSVDLCGARGKAPGEGKKKEKTEETMGEVKKRKNLMGVPHIKGFRIRKPTQKRAKRGVRSARRNRPPPPSTIGIRSWGPPSRGRAGPKKRKREKAAIQLQRVFWRHKQPKTSRKSRGTPTVRVKDHQD